MASSILNLLEDDGFYHPANEHDIILLIHEAVTSSLEIRCRGAAHSLAHAIYTDTGKGRPQLPNTVSEQLPPQGPNINIMLDRYNNLVWIDEINGIIEVEAGIHLGYDPQDPKGASTIENSLLYQIEKKGFALSDLGGISHQTVSGFLMTGSSGGSLMYGIDDNILALSIIDSSGNVEWFAKDDENFGAAALSMGLLGIVSKIRFQLMPNFYIYGQQITYPSNTKECPIDLLGSGSNTKLGLKDFLQKTPYARLLWWPQEKVKRLVIWEASRGAVLPAFNPVPYEEFSRNAFVSNLEQLGGSLLFTLLGNQKFSTAWPKLKPSFAEFKRLTQQAWHSSFWAVLITSIIKAISYLLALILMTFKGLLHTIYPVIINMLQPLTKKGRAMLFMDHTWSSLPMDNCANDITMGTEFTEIWIPLEYTQPTMKLLDEMFTAEQLKSTGYYSTEIYAGKKSKFWLSPAYEQDTVRIDFFWFTGNEGNPADRNGFFSQFWEKLREKQIPFRLHWAKFMPEYNYDSWATYFKSQYPRWDEFMKLRASRDPHDVFLTDYWSLHLFGKKKNDNASQTINYETPLTVV